MRLLLFFITVLIGSLNLKGAGVPLIGRMSTTVDGYPFIVDYNGTYNNNFVSVYATIVQNGTPGSMGFELYVNCVNLTNTSWSPPITYSVFSSKYTGGQTLISSGPVTLQNQPGTGKLKYGIRIRDGYYIFFI
jgi:hypothetical protein